MNWTIGLILAIGVVLPVGLGLGLGAYRAAQSPKVMAEAAALLVAAVMPIISKYVTKRSSPEIEESMRKVWRRAGEWDNFRKRER